FQAGDGIRDLTVTGVQTCALPICVLADAWDAGADRFVLGGDYALFGPFPAETVSALEHVQNTTWIRGNVDRWTAHPDEAPDDERSEERRVGKERRSPAGADD